MGQRVRENKRPHAGSIPSSKAHSPASRRRKATAPESQEELKDVLFKTVHRFFPSLTKWLNNIPDPRNPNKITYPIAHVLWTGILLFVCKLESRRQIKFNFNTPQFLRNLNTLAGSLMERVCDHDTVAYLAKLLDTKELSKIRVKMLGRLLRNKCLLHGRLLEEYYLIAFDGSGLRWFNRSHCDKCIKQVRNGRTYYYHNVLEAKLILPNGLAFSIDTELIENETPDATKQDCELKAFYRLVPRIKKAFPQLKVCVLLDSLYAAGPVFDICKKHKWKYIITFKRGSMPEVFTEFENLKRVTPENSSSNSIPHGSQEWHWVNDISYRDHKLHVLECLENKLLKKKIGNGKLKRKRERTRWVWLTNFHIHNGNFLALGKGGRLRWKIENEGFNTQKNGGYALEHVYITDGTGDEIFYIFLQIAHFLNQLIEKGSLLKPLIEHCFGSIRNVARRLLESLRIHATTPGELDQLLATPFQIRLDSS